MYGIFDSVFFYVFFGYSLGGLLVFELVYVMCWCGFEGLLVLFFFGVFLFVENDVSGYWCVKVDVELVVVLCDYWGILEVVFNDLLLM